MDLDYGELFEDWEIGIAKKLIIEFQRKWRCLSREHINDLLQECLTRWFFARNNYNPTRGASQKTFMARAIRNRLMDLVREREADKRKVAHLAVSLDEPPEDDGGLTSATGRVDQKVPADPELCSLQVGLAVDVRRVSGKLSPKQKQVCALLMRGLDITEVAKALETPRSTLYDEIARIRRIFQEAGLEAYLD